MAAFLSLTSALKQVPTKLIHTKSIEIWDIFERVIYFHCILYKVQCRFAQKKKCMVNSGKNKYKAMC